MVGHEVVFVYDVVLTEPGLASQDVFTYDESGDQTGLRGEWRSLRGFQSGEDGLFPDGLLGLLES